MKKLSLICLVLLIALQLKAQDYTPTASNLKQRAWFNDARFGLFIHWGPFSIPGSGEWVMNERKLNVHNYTNLKDFFNPVEFNAEQWVSMAKNAGMKYITLITRHHDGFSMWNTKYSDFNIMNTPYKKDIVKLMADECHKQGIKLYLYYSLLDWRREDYPHETGRTGQNSGRTGKGDYASYLQFMKNQLTELLTNYGEIGGIWFDGHWDQTEPEGSKDRTSRIDWKYNEIYGLIHKLQPQCMIGNNHHLSPFAGEDFQMFERDLPGENKSGLSFQKASDKLPLETCETISNSWGYNLSDTYYKSNKELVHMLVKAASLGSNLLLNIGPMPSGKIQPEFQDRLAGLGNWLKIYGESIYGTKAGFIKPQTWGSITQNDNKIFIHILDEKTTSLDLENVPVKKIKKAYLLKDKSPVNYTFKKAKLSITTTLNTTEPDQVIVLEIG
ncbi:MULTISPECIES: alpha-L-fucosidase [unclassified Pedobacter]|uniref:alpha-L-fucosidase n=1 Tax=unclassified Pedobacter TaxID=2628915 RepID=UPI001423D7B3|nr:MULTISPECIES: alpha-L-fucosidase [unclassified Pedobacter]NII84543.1 alpha-L-fucosidase [Pedobacter sp. SG908]NMN38543.1 alpha-L-fucosidase [Pedobacter sp. SG918]